MFKKKKHILDENIIKKIYKKDRLVRYTEFLLGLFLVSVAFNVFILPNDIVYGVSGLGVIAKRLWGIDPSLIIMGCNLFLVVLSFTLLGKEKTTNSVVGSLLYPVMVKLTETMTNYIDVVGAEPLILILFGAVINGFGLGLIFKAGFTTGGSDIINQVCAKYGKMSIGKAMIFTDGAIVFLSVLAFGWIPLMYSLLTLYIISVLTDKVILGISQSKAFYIITDHETEIKSFILRHLSHGVTVLEGHGGYTGNRQKVIMCIIPTKEYFIFKEGIHEIDKNAFFVVTDAYEVSGGE